MNDLAIRIKDATDVAQARRVAARLGSETGLDEKDAGRLSLVVTEAATNLLRHASDGEMLLRRANVEGGVAVEVLALDAGPGVADMKHSLEDGYSTVGGSGTGLGAIKRLADAFDFHTAPGKGTALLMRVGPGAIDKGHSLFRVGAVSVPLTGETANGDAWAVHEHDGVVTVLLVDGLGHGPEAAEAARAALASVAKRWTDPLPDLLRAAHSDLLHTRGAAMALARVDEAQLTFAGVGNIGARVIDSTVSHGLVSHNGTVGHVLDRVQSFGRPWPGRGTLLILHTDGLRTHWDLGTYPTARSMDPSLLAALLYRDASRHRDDATVVVLRDEHGS